MSNNEKLYSLMLTLDYLHNYKSSVGTDSMKKSIQEDIDAVMREAKRLYKEELESE